MGFRPFVYRVARGLGLTGWVRNDPAGVAIEAQGEAGRLELLFSALEHEAPPLAVIGSLTTESIPLVSGEDGFLILASGTGGATAEIAPDGNVCADCLAEMYDPSDRRYRYPFINCTNCGPRYSIITGIPYDRPLTTMAPFALCQACRAEYENPLDRRFHAQPVACPVCGPALSLVDNSGVPEPGDPVAATVNLLKQGKIVAIKGVGGYHLAVDAGNSAALMELRLRKRRPDKPFAVMVRDIASAREAARLDQLEERLLAAPERPIVLVRRRESGVAPEVAPGSNYLGIMLPATPLQHLLLDGFGAPLVMTSGNRSSEPVAFDDDEAFHALSGIADYFLANNRAIQTRVDDSVIRVFRGNPLFIRRSRGYAPRAIRLAASQPPVLAVGAELKGACCLTREDQAFMSQHIGDLRNVETVAALADTADHLQRLLEIRPVAVAHDLHPDYLSTRFAQEQTGLPLVPVQHHHGHMVSCMAENRLTGQAIGVVFDGTGYGPDGTVWGGEFLVGGPDGFRRMGSFGQALLPGGDAAVNEPYRMAISWLYEARGSAAFELPADRFPFLHTPERPLLRQMIERRFNSPPTSSCGRLFDAVSALIGLRSAVSYEGQAAIELEAMAEGVAADNGYPWEIATADDRLEIDWRPLFVALVADIFAGVAQGIMARRFHSSIAQASVAVCRRLRDETGENAVVLSGGVFQNRMLTEELATLLGANGFAVFTHRLVPPNDGGLALGQAVIAGRKWR
ncbi:carbamoyltransferase hypF2 [Geobacter sp. OR-1]|nr:carbamoyltransferase hypF2 [Geobacter sp. OR-1]